MTDPTLHPVLDRASDGVRPARSPQHAASAALARAHLVRRRRRAGGAVGAVAAAVVVAVAVLGVPGSNRAEPPVAPAPTAPPAHGVADEDVQPELDPRTAGSLPRRDSVLPASVAPPAEAADLGRLPTSGPVRLVLGAGRSELLLLGVDDRWTATRTPSGEASTTGISDDGTLLASIGPAGLWVVDVREGTWRELALPDGTPAWWTGLGTRVQWQGDRVVLSNLGQLLTVPTGGGARTRPSRGVAGSSRPPVSSSSAGTAHSSWARDGAGAARSSPRSRVAASRGSCRSRRWSTSPTPS